MRVSPFFSELSDSNLMSSSHSDGLLMPNTSEMSNFSSMSDISSVDGSSPFSLGFLDIDMVNSDSSLVSLVVLSSVGSHFMLISVSVSSKGSVVGDSQLMSGGSEFLINNSQVFNPLSSDGGCSGGGRLMS